MPSFLVERCLRTGTRIGDTVLDPFGGIGTVAIVADRWNRDAVSLELNPSYIELAKKNVLKKIEFIDLLHENRRMSL